MPFLQRSVRVENAPASVVSGERLSPRKSTTLPWYQWLEGVKNAPVSVSGSNKNPRGHWEGTLDFGGK